MRNPRAAQKIGQNVRYWRKRRALSQGQLANAAGLTLSTITRIERGITRPQPTTIYKLALALSVTIEEVLRDAF
jgi:transcriptional regulator with XRE-family HTH domain